MSQIRKIFPSFNAIKSKIKIRKGLPSDSDNEEREILEGEDIQINKSRYDPSHRPDDINGVFLALNDSFNGIVAAAIVSIPNIASGEDASLIPPTMLMRTTALVMIAQPLLAVPPRGASGARGVAVSTHAGAGAAANEVRRGRDAATGTAVVAGLAALAVRGEVAGRAAVAGIGFAVVIVPGSEAGDVRVHARVAVRGRVSVATRRFATDIALTVTILQSRINGAMAVDCFVVFRVVGELKAFDGSSALVADIADDVGNSVGLVAEMAIGGIGNGEARAWFGTDEGREKAGFHFWSDLLISQGRGAWAVCTLSFINAGKTFRGSCRAFDGGVFNVFRHVFVAVANVSVELGSLLEGLDNVLHMMGLTVDESAEVEHNALGFIPLTSDGGVGVLKS